MIGRPVPADPPEVRAAVLDFSARQVAGRMRDADPGDLDDTVARAMDLLDRLGWDFTFAELQDAVNGHL